METEEYHSENAVFCELTELIKNYETLLFLRDCLIGKPNSWPAVEAYDRERDELIEEILRQLGKCDVEDIRQLFNNGNTWFDPLTEI